MSLLIGDNVVATIHYTLTDNDGETLDTSAGGDPLKYLHGAGNLIPGLEKELVGKTAGATLQVKVAPAEAYGELQPEMVEVVPKEAFQGVESIEPGMVFQAQGSDGEVRQIVVKSVEDEQITIDGNHPLAGVELNFDVEVLEVREATAEELSHGHVH